MKVSFQILIGMRTKAREAVTGHCESGQEKTLLPFVVQCSGFFVYPKTGESESAALMSPKKLR